MLLFFVLFCFAGFEENLLKRGTLRIVVKLATHQRNLVQDRSVVSGLKCLEKKKRF